MTGAPQGPLAGIRVVDLTSVVMGPYATQLLGDYGADVIKVEPPDGDVMRQSGPMRNRGMGHLYMTTNRSKRSIAIDLKDERGRNILLRLCKSADVLVYNLRPQAMARLRLSYEDIRSVNPRIIYVGAFGFSQRGPYAARPAYDDLIQGMAGIPSLTQLAGSQPRYVPLIFADRTVGLQLAFAIASALVYRERHGEGQRVDVPMYEGLLSVVLGEHLAGELFRPPIGPAGYQRSLSPNRRPYKTTDGHICVLIYTDKHWRKFFEAIGEHDLFETDQRFSSQGLRAANIDAVYAALSDILATRGTDEWLALFEVADIPAARMYSIDDILHDDHLAAIGYFRDCQHPTEGTITALAVPTEWSLSAPAVGRHAPQLGEHTREIMREAGYGEEAITQHLDSGVVRQALTGHDRPDENPAET